MSEEKQISDEKKEDEENKNEDAVDSIEEMKKQQALRHKRMAYAEDNEGREI